MSARDATSPGRPETIRAVPVRHPGRWVSVVVIAVLVAMFGHMLATNDAFQWSFMFENMFRPPVLRGARTTIVLTVLAMLIGVALGILLAVMRLSPNPVLSWTAWFYTWIFRSVPRIVLAILFGNLAIIFANGQIDFGLPFDNYLLPLFGLEGDATLFGLDSREVLSGFMAGLLMLALSEAAYMAEIVRAGILAVDSGQTEAAQALGMSRSRILRRIVLPQAMRVILPPTGNETIAMLKDTALVAFVPVSNELFFQISAVGSRTFQVFPMLVAACLWYIAMTSVLLVGQHFLEKRFSRGFGRRSGRVRAALPAGGPQGSV
ncbi:MAG TPA: amino acid ABC transporter permease [Mycobacteriales bacterium]|nr:amino acid ABC transporter permease [Mycobacteriales bacterium]